MGDWAVDSLIVSQFDVEICSQYCSLSLWRTDCWFSKHRDSLVEIDCCSLEAPEVVAPAAVAPVVVVEPDVVAPAAVAVVVDHRLATIMQHSALACLL